MTNWLRRRAPSPPVPELIPDPSPDLPSDPDMMPMLMSVEARIHMATVCRDADSVQKVPQSGSVVTAPDGTLVQIMHNGLRVVADGYCGSWMTDLIARCRGHHEPQEERIFHEILPRFSDNATMIELGGWWAFYTLWFLQGKPNRRSFVLEPDPRHMAVGVANARLNGATVPFCAGFVGATSAPMLPFHSESGEQLSIPRFTVPQLMAAQGFERLDLLHCDTQGAELDVIEGCADLLRAGRIGVIVVSTHHWTISGDPLTHQRCLARVLAYGGKIIAEHDVHESFSGDGLIVAAFGPESSNFPSIPLSHNRYSESLFRNPLYDLSERGGNRT
jgi:FkbM family methyltransferase